MFKLRRCVLSHWLANPVIEQDKHYIQLCDQYLGTTNLLSVSKDRQIGHISCSKLRERFFYVPENESEEQLGKHVRAYVLHDIGSIFA